MEFCLPESWPRELAKMSGWRRIGVAKLELNHRNSYCFIIPSKKPIGNAEAIAITNSLFMSLVYLDLHPTDSHLTLALRYHRRYCPSTPHGDACPAKTILPFATHAKGKYRKLFTPSLPLGGVNFTSSPSFPQLLPAPTRSSPHSPTDGTGMAWPSWTDMNGRQPRFLEVEPGSWASVGTHDTLHMVRGGRFMWVRLLTAEMARYRQDLQKHVVSG